MTTDKTDGNVVIGHVNVKEEGLLFTTLPYDKGYTVYVDGVKSEYHKVLDTFIGIVLEEG